MGGGASKSSSQGATSGMSAQQGSSTGNGNTIPTGQPSDPNGLEPVNRARHNEGEDMSGPPDRLGSGPMEDIDDRSRGNLGSSSEEMGYKGGGDGSDLADILQENTKETVSVVLHVWQLNYPYVILQIFSTCMWKYILLLYFKEK